MRDARSAIEPFRLQDAMQLTDDLTVIVIERQPDFGSSVEDHNGHSVFRRQYSQRMLGRVRNPLDMRLHTPTHIEEQQYVNRHVLVAEFANLLNFSIHPQHKVIGLQTRDWPAGAVDDLSVHTRHRNIALENCRVVSGEGRNGADYGR